MVAWWKASQTILVQLQADSIAKVEQTPQRTAALYSVHYSMKDAVCILGHTSFSGGQKKNQYTGIL